MGWQATLEVFFHNAPKPKWQLSVFVFALANKKK